MTEKKIDIIHLIYGICMSVLSVTLAILCIVLCLDIYNSGDDPFTRESIGKSFSYIAVLVYFYIAAVIGGVVLNIAMPKKQQRIRGTVDDTVVLSRLSARASNISKEGIDRIDKQRAIRFIMMVISFVLVLGAIISALVIIPSDFDANNESTNNEVLSGWLSTLRYFVIPFVQLIVTAFVCRYSVRKELEIVREELKKQKTEGDVSVNQENEQQIGTFTKITNEFSLVAKKISEPKKWHKPLSIAIKCAIGCLAVVFIIVGIMNDGQVDVVNKACQICRECIGMG